MARPRAAQSLMPSLFMSGGPSIAPRMPVRMTRTAVSEGKPPSCSAMPMATGAVTDFGAIETMEFPASAEKPYDANRAQRRRQRAGEEASQDRQARSPYSLDLR